MYGWAKEADVELKFTIALREFASSAGSASRTTRKVPVRLTPMIWFHSSRLVSWVCASAQDARRVDQRIQAAERLDGRGARRRSPSPRCRRRCGMVVRRPAVAASSARACVWIQAVRRDVGGHHGGALVEQAAARWPGRSPTRRPSPGSACPRVASSAAPVTRRAHHRKEPHTGLEKRAQWRHGHRIHRPGKDGPGHGREPLEGGPPRHRLQPLPREGGSARAAGRSGGAHRRRRVQRRGRVHHAGR